MIWKNKKKGNIINSYRYIYSDNLQYFQNLDVVDPSFAQGTTLPEPGGLSPWEILEILISINIDKFGVDITEVIPG